MDAVVLTRPRAEADGCNADTEADVCDASATDAEASTDAVSGQARPRRRLGRRALGSAVCVVLLGLAAARLVVEPMTVRSSSMEPSLTDGDRVWVEKLSIHWRAPSRGDVVVVDSPALGGLIVKRVVGVAGDTVAIEDGVLLVNGFAPPDPGRRDPEVSEFFGPVTVPDGEVFLLGDNRRDSGDSRQWGTVPVDRVVGRVWIGG